MIEQGGQGYDPQYAQVSEFITVISTAKQIVKGIIATEQHTSVEHLKTTE